MAIKEALLPEFDQEMGSTRKMLDRVPDGKFDWQPHKKSMSLGRLASHVAELPHWGVSTVKADSFDVAPPGGTEYKPPTYASKAELVAAFDRNAAEARALIESMDDGAFMQPWSLLRAGQAMFTMPKVAVVRSFVFNHLYHHRGQLSVYLRLLDVPVPGTYGPSADEMGM